MSKLIEWSPSDYSPTYMFHVDGDGNFEGLHRVRNIPTGWPQSREIDITEFHIKYMTGDGFEKYKKHIAWLNNVDSYDDVHKVDK